MATQEDSAESGLIDLSFLTDEERNAILKVVEKDISLDKEAFSSLEFAVSNGRRLQREHSDENEWLLHNCFMIEGACSCCGSKFTNLLDRIVIHRCSQCRYLICSKCTIKTAKLVEKQRFCNICHKERYLDILSKERLLGSQSESQVSGSWLIQNSLKMSCTVTAPVEEPTVKETVEPTMEDTVDPKQSEMSYAKKIGISRRPKGDQYEVTGDLEFDIYYRHLFYGRRLTVHIVRASGLVAVNKSTSSSNPYVKMYLLPDLNTKKKTRVKQGTYPTFDQTFDFAIPSKKMIRKSCLWISVWSHEALQRNHFLGETWIKFDSYNLDDPIKEHFKLNLLDAIQELKT